jgi:formylglycine-generating enzyme required for sulfatase activity
MRIEAGMTLPSDYLSRTGYRLPTEAEWEFACRANSAASHFYGGSVEMLPKFGWYLENADDHVHPAGQLKPNDLGLFDMLGNVFEWIQDPYKQYQAGPSERAIVDAEIHAEFSDNIPRALRGGAIFSAARLLRSAARNSNPPSDRFEFIIGFRLARTHG